MSGHIKDLSAEFGYIRNYINSLYYFACYKEYTGEVRAQLNSAFSKGMLDIDTYKNFNKSYYSSQISLDDFNKSANEKYLNKLQNYDNNDDFKFVKKSIETSLNNPNSVSLNISSIDWFDNITSYINNLKNVENDIFNDILKVAKDKNSGLYSQLIIISSIVLFVLFVIYYLAYLIISSIIRNIKLATQLAVNISNGIMIDIK